MYSTVLVQYRKVGASMKLRFDPDLNCPKCNYSNVGIMALLFLGNSDV